jgi:hypothetical protein
MVHGSPLTVSQVAAWQSAILELVKVEAMVVDPILAGKLGMLILLHQQTMSLPNPPFLSNSRKVPTKA